MPLRLVPRQPEIRPPMRRERFRLPPPPSRQGQKRVHAQNSGGGGACLEDSLHPFPLKDVEQGQRRARRALGHPFELRHKADRQIEI